MTTGKNSFDGYVYTYPWKGELAPYVADLEKVVPAIEGAPSPDLDDYPGDVINAYRLVDGKLIGLPILGDATMLVWNKAQYEKVGIDPMAPPSSWAVGINDSSKNKEAAAHWATYLASREVQHDAPAPARISVLSDPGLVASRPHFPAVLAALGGELALFPNVPQSAQIITYMYEELNAVLGGD